METYKQLTPEQRCQIEVLKKSGFTQQAIADLLKVSQSTVSRELKRNTGLKGYRHNQAQRLSKERRYKPIIPPKMTVEVVLLMKEKLALKWSPEQISHHLCTQGMPVSHERLYLYIWQDKKEGGMLYQHLRRQGKKYNKRRHGKTNRGRIKNQVSIDLRPKEVEEKSRIGDWEIDTVIGKGQSGALVTIVERATQFTLSARVLRTTAREVTDTTIRLLTPYRKALHTITADNGKEFAYHEEITKALHAPVYFAHPYCSWERGLNENTNGLLRQYWPKKTDFKQISQAEVILTVNQLNDRPRKTLGYEKPATLMHNYLKYKVA